MQWLAGPVVRRLDRLVAGLHREGLDVRREEVVAALVLNWSDYSPDGLFQLILPFKKKHAPPRRQSQRGKPVVLHLPSPITLRIDALVEIAREMGTVYRHELVGALIMAAKQDSRWLKGVVESYSAATAADAVPHGVSPSKVLDLKPPSPGPRRHRHAGT